MILIYIVCANTEEARRISSHLVEQRLAACTNMHPITSTYWWEGKVVEENEIALIAKTVPANFERVKEAVLKLHSYQVPCIISIPVDHVESRYLEWLQGEIR
ncbi:MAG: divalent-cation tolerance protein CutA [Chloroflexi bacterium]|nr:divalent-cation tolerance protein CutA [Chloroflexota bacterium]